NTTEINAVLAYGGTITGKVTNSGGIGLAYAEVSVYDLNGNLVGSSPGAYTAQDGSYTINGLPIGSYKVYFAPGLNSGYLSQWYNNKSDQNSADVVTITGPNTTVINAVLAPCTFKLQSSSAFFGKNGGNGSVLVDTASSCQLVAAINVSWITSGGLGYGSGPIGYSVAANNSGVTRTGTITVSNQTFTVTQSALVSPGGTWIDLGTLTGGSMSSALSVSSDGSVAVGQAFINDPAYPLIGRSRAFRWTQDGGMADLGDLPGGSQAEAYGVSAIGDVVVGAALDSSGNAHAFRWTQDGGMADLGDLPGGSQAEAYGVSAIGDVVVGAALDSFGNTHAFSWTQAVGMVDLGTLSNGSQAVALAVSGDPGVIGGLALDNNGNTHAVQWTQNGIVDLGTVSGGSIDNDAVSADGSVVVGGLWFDSVTYHAFQWTPDSGVFDLGSLGGNSGALNVSSDGNVVVGWALASNDFATACRWSNSTGLLTIDQWLIVNGVDVTGSNFYEAYGVSADGNSVVGQLLNNHAFVAHVGPITCPDNLVESGGTAYSTIQEAYTTATSGQSIQMQALEFQEDLIMTRDIYVLLQGGFGCDYSFNSGFSTIQGSLMISGGTVTVENVILQ
ncbi:MAG: carboxypeptidase regulatory-like domain-containing protein, partial [Dissulfurispiraceae bacterium]